MRYNIYDKEGKLIAQDYQRANGQWMHKWKSTNHEGFDRFSWRGKAKGEVEAMKTWIYVEVKAVAKTKKRISNKV